MSSSQGGTPDQSFQDRINKVAERNAPAAEAQAVVEAGPDIAARIKYPAILLGLAVIGMLGFAYLMPKSEEAEVAETVEPEEKQLPSVIRLN